MNVQKVNTLEFASLTSSMSFTGRDSWLELVHEMYHYNIHRFAVEEEAQIIAALGMAEIHHPVFGHYLATAPFGSHGGFAFKNIEARDLLLAESRRLAEETKVEYVSIRFDQVASPPPEGWQQSHNYFTYLIDLPAAPEEILKSFSSDHRNHVRKSLKKGFTIRFGQLELLDEVYLALAKSMHELGSPYHSKAYLRRMAELLKDTLEFAVLYNAQGKISGGGVFMYQGDVIFNLHANILRHTRSSYAGEFLYWSLIKRAISKGMKTFDLGRSLVGSGNEVFKLKWAPRKQALAYWFWLAPGAEMPSLNQKNPKFQLAIAIWKLLPAFVVRVLGPLLIRGLA